MQRLKSEICDTFPLIKKYTWYDVIIEIKIIRVQKYFNNDFYLTVFKKTYIYTRIYIRLCFSK